MIQQMASTPQTIRRFEVTPDSDALIAIKMPAGALILTVKRDGSPDTVYGQRFFISAICDLDQRLQTRYIDTIGTDDEITQDGWDRRYIGTTPDGITDWHWFEVLA